MSGPWSGGKRSHGSLLFPMAKLTPTPNGYQCDVRINKKRIRQILHRDRAKAKRILKDMIAVGKAKRRGRTVVDMSWMYFRTDYLRKSKLNDRPGTYNHNRRAFELVDRVIHVEKLDNMTPELLNEVQTRLKEALTPLKKPKYGSQAISRAIRAIITAMRRAEDFKYIEVQNWRLVKVEIRRGRLDFFEVDRYFELLGRLEGIWRTSGWLMGRAGLRTGEAIHLEWSDIQFENDRIIFTSKPDIPWRIKGDKELDKVRSISLYPDLKDYLGSTRKASGFVLELPFARRVDAFGKRFTAALAATGVPTYRNKKAIPYTLRHTFGSHLAQAGASEAIIAELMGHEDTSMVKIYSHLRPVDMHKGVISLKNLVSVLRPHESSLPTPTALLSPLNADLAQTELSSKIDETT